MPSTFYNLANTFPSVCVSIAPMRSLPKTAFGHVDMCFCAILCMQVVAEVHDVSSRLQEFTRLLQAEGFALRSRRGLVPQTHIVYASRHRAMP